MSNLDLLKTLILESIEFIGVFIVYLYVIPFVKEKHNKNLSDIIHRESLIRLGIILTLGLELGLAPIIALITKSTSNILYDILLLRIGDMGSSRVTTQLMLFVLFISIMIIQDGINPQKWNPYFASAFTLDMAFLHELVWQTLYIISYQGISNEYYLLVQELSYIEGVIILTIVSYKLNPKVFKFLPPLFFWINYMLYWWIIGLPITVYNATYKAFTETKYYLSYTVNAYEFFSWLVIFIIFLMNILLLKYWSKHKVIIH